MMRPIKIDEAEAIAVEHVLWARATGLTARQMLAAIGVEWPGRHPVPVDILIFHYASAWLKLWSKGSGGGTY